MIRLAESDPEVERCYPVMQQLRPQVPESAFLARVREQQRDGYRLVFLEEDGEVKAVAGFRILQKLVSGRELYVDDLVTDSALRSRGHGQALFDWLVEHARREGCRTLELDSGVERFGAHRFYLRNRMVISSHHFRLRLDG